MPLTDFPERFDLLREVMLETGEGRFQRNSIERVRHNPPYISVIFSGLSSVEQVDSLRGAFLHIPEEDRVPLPEGQYYQFELEGLDVLLEGGDVLGKLVDIIKTGSNDVFVVDSGAHEYLIPALRSIIKSIDLPHHRIIIRPVEGLLE